MAANAQKCPKCQRDVAADARFCQVCGARVGGTPRKLHRNRDGAKIGGVCAGLADYFDLDPTLMRVLYLVGTFFTGIVPGIILYLILAIVMPTE